MPANLAPRPLGRVASSELSSPSPSARAMWRVKGLGWPAALDSLPALMVGAKGRPAGEAGQALPPGPEPTLKLAVG